MRMTLEGSKAILVIENNVREIFNDHTAVRQGNTITVILFNLVLDYIMKKLVIRRNI